MPRDLFVFFKIFFSMDFSVDVNSTVKDEIIAVDSSMVAQSSCRDSKQKTLANIIDKMGAASAKAQGLHAVITSAHRFIHSNHRLYIMKCAEDNNGLGSIVGILKVGAKHLFVFDSHGNQHEMSPLCILDFYVHESRQRMGCGKKLFEFMLQNEAVKPQHLAIDRPSHKFQSFLTKHYKLKATIPQTNNFVVFEGFFRDRQDKQARNRRYNKDFMNSTPEKEAETFRHIPLQRTREALSSQSTPTIISRPPSGMMAHNNMYSRHAATPPPPSPAQPTYTRQNDAVRANSRLNNLQPTGQTNVEGDASTRLTAASTATATTSAVTSPATSSNTILSATATVNNKQQAANNTTTSSGPTEKPPMHSSPSRRSPSKKNSQDKTRVKQQQPWVNPYADPDAAPPRRDLGSGWNIFGVPPAHYNHTATTQRRPANNIW